MESEYKVLKEKALRHFENLLDAQYKRAERLKAEAGFADYTSLDRLVIGVCGGDGIGPYICGIARNVLEFLLRSEIESGKIELRDIEGLTIENRAACGKAVPDGVLEQIKACHVILKGPTTTPRAGDPWPNIESANVALRKELDLFANVRPVKVPELGIDWTFFRENTEGGYALGSDGVRIGDGLALDFVVTTAAGTERIARLAFEYARNNGIKRVDIVTKANVIKTTDGEFLSVCRRVGSEYPEIAQDDWYIDIMAAKLVDERRRRDFRVVILPNLYGDIITDEAAQIQGGVGTAGSANIGRRCAMFEAVHGSAPRMVKEGRTAYADPRSMLRAAVLLLRHIGRNAAAERLERALDLCAREGAVQMTGRSGGATGEQFAEYLKTRL